MVGRATGSESGAATTEVVLLFPVLLLVLLFSVQFGLWFHASHVALAAAQEGARAGREAGPSPRDPASVTNGFLERLGNGLLESPRVTVANDGDTVRVEVQAHVTKVVFIPGISFPVHAVSQGPIEKFRADQ